MKSLTKYLQTFARQYSKACFLLLNFYFFSDSQLYSQDKKTDSLKAIIHSGSKKEKVDALNKLCRKLMYDKPADAKNYVLQAINIAENINYSLGTADAYNTIGIVYDISGKYDSSIFYYEKALPIFNKIKDVKGRGSATNNLGLIYWNLSEYDKALEYFFRALKDFEEIKNNEFIANALNNIGLIYSDIKKYPQSLEYHLKAKLIYEKINDNYLKGAVFTNLGNVYFCLNNNDSAGIYYKKAIEMQTLANDSYGLSTAYNGYAGLLVDQKQYPAALDYFKKALTLKQEMDEKVGISSILSQLADIYKRTGNRELQLLYLDSARAIAEQNDFKKDLTIIYEELSHYYEKTNLPLSYEYYKKLTAAKDSIFNETSNKQITELNTKYETQKKEQQLKLQRYQIQRKNYLLWSLIAILGLLIFSGFSFYRKKQVQENLKLQEAVMQERDDATKSVMAAEENERKRIAGELHDGVGQMMSAAKMNLSVFENEIPFKDAEQKKSFEKIINLVDESCREVRSVSHQMMPNALLGSGLAGAVKEFIEKIDSRLIKITLHTEGLDERVDSNTETVLYRVIQECVNNVLKHAGAGKLDISLIKDSDGISATIEDNGKGFDSNGNIETTGIGLKNIISRITYLKGSIDFDSSPGKGTLVAIHVPLI